MTVVLTTLIGMLITLMAPTTPQIEDAAWSWWSKPSAIEQNGSLWVASVSASGNVQVDIDGVRTVIAQVEGDDHNTPVLAAGRVFYARHTKDNFIYHRTFDGSTVGEEQTIAFPDTVSYVQALEHGDTVVLLTRSARCLWYATISDNGGDTWGPPVQVIDGCPQEGLIYMTTGDHPAAGTFRIAVYGHPNGSAWDRIEYGLIRLASGNISIPGNQVIANLYTGEGLPLVYGDLDPAYESTSMRLLDVGTWNGNPAVVLADWTDSLPRYRTSVYQDGIWVASDVGRYAPVFHDQANYVSGAIFADDQLVTVAEMGGLWLIEAWGDGSPQVIGGRHTPLIRPIAVGKTLFVQSINSYTDYLNWSVDVYRFTLP